MCSIALVHLMTANNSAISEKVVIQFGTRMVKGYLESPVRNTIEELLTDAPVSAPETFRIHLLESDTIEEISIKDIKAVFYVHSFDGDTKHKALNFYGKSPVVHGIWMMIRFLDGEVMEGIVHNSIRYLVDLQQQQARLRCKESALRPSSSRYTQLLRDGHTLPEMTCPFFLIRP